MPELCFLRHLTLDPLDTLFILLASDDTFLNDYFYITCEFFFASPANISYEYVMNMLLAYESLYFNLNSMNT